MSYTILSEFDEVSVDLADGIYDEILEGSSIGQLWARAQK